MSPFSLLPLHSGQAANKCTCISPVFFVNGYIPPDHVPQSLRNELAISNKLVEFVMPQLSYYASRYQKDNKVKPRDMFSDKSSFTEEVILPLIFDFKTFEGVPIYIDRPGVWSIVNKIGLIYCQAAAIISEKAKSLGSRVGASEWKEFVKATFSNVTNSKHFSSYSIFPIQSLRADIFWEGGFSFLLTLFEPTSVNVNELKYLHEIKLRYNKEPDHLILTESDDGAIKFSFAYDFSQSGGAKALYSFSSTIHDTFPEFDYYRYNGKADPFYYPLTCYHK